MTSISVRRDLNQQQYEAMFADATAEVMPSASRPFIAHSVALKFRRAWIFSGKESSGCIKHLAQRPARAFVTFLAQRGPEVLIDGMAIPPSGLVRHSLAHDYHERSSGPTVRAHISLPINVVTDAGFTLLGCDLFPPRRTLRVIPQATAMIELLRLHDAVRALAETEPARLAHAEVERALEQSLIHAMAKCMGSPGSEAETWAYRCHETIMRRFRRVLDEHPDRALYVPEICAAVGVPDRTLRLCFHEHLGMGPKKYLVLRRLQLAQRTLSAASPDGTNVTEVATRYGFWHFGRFASSYRAVFGELPSITLKRPSN